MLLKEQASDYAKKLRSWLEPYLAVKPAQETTRRCCVYISAKDFSIVDTNRAGDLVEVLYFEKIQYDNIESLALVLPGIFQKHNLTTVPCSWLLAPPEYQLFLIESLPVSRDELQDAVTWRVRSLINYPIEEAVIDFFELPPKKNTPSHPMIAAIVTRQTTLTKVANIFRQNTLALKVIDIPELALRNLTALYEDNEKSTAMVYFYGNTIYLNITRQKTIYFTRKMAIPVAENGDLDYEKLSLDILRYFDYFQSQWRHASPARVFIISEGQNDGEIAETFSKHLLVHAEPYKLKSIIASENQLNTLNQHFLLPMGGALRGVNR